MVTSWLELFTYQISDGFKASFLVTECSIKDENQKRGSIEENDSSLGTKLACIVSVHPGRENQYS